MKTVFLRFPDVDTALAAFSAVTGQEVASLADVPSKVAVSGLLCDVDPIGPLTNSAGEPVPGWHVNVWTPDEAAIPADLGLFRVYPVSPSRVFG